MYYSNINTFLPWYQNRTKEELASIIKQASINPGLIYKYEKDFLLTLILIKFGEKYPNLIFKWGTCLNKTYFPYFRLSEDLDFVINQDLGRSARQTLLREYEESFVSDLRLLGLTLRAERTKYDEHRLAMFTFEYSSIFDSSLQTIKIDISLKSSLICPTKKLPIKSVYTDQFLEEPIFSQDHTINCIDLTESVAEKMRAALTRREPAIRDFFDIWYVRSFSDFDFERDEFCSLLRYKLAEVQYEYTLETNYDLLRRQIETDLRPVLTDNYGFDFDTIYTFILSYKI